MTIEKGKEWGTLTGVPSDAAVAHTDAEVVKRWVAAPVEPILLRGGDLFRSLGSPPQRDPAMQLPIDLLQVTTDSGVVHAAAHIIVRSRSWRGRILAVMNTDFVRSWNVAPRAHPNDGRMDIVEVAADMGWRQRWQARRRLETGTHVPHPSIKVSTATQVAYEFPRPMRVFIDGQPCPPTQRLSVVVLADAATIIA